MTHETTVTYKTDPEDHVPMKEPISQEVKFPQTESEGNHVQERLPFQTSLDHRSEDAQINCSQTIHQIEYN